MNGTLIKAIDSVGDPPLPIPNREVKPVSADGTAKIRGRVGHRHFLARESFKQLRLSFFAVDPPCLSGPMVLRRWPSRKFGSPANYRGNIFLTQTKH